MVPWVFRNAWEQSLRAVGINEEQARQVTFGGADGFDLTSWEKGTKQNNRKSHDLEELALVVGHVTDVTGGYGVSKRRVKFWLRALRNGTAMEMVPSQVFFSLPYGEDIGRARRLALWERYRNAAYHQIGASNGDNIANHALELWKHHGNLGNYGAGWALDVGAKEELDEWKILTGRASLRSLLHRIDPTGQREILMAHHRAFSPDRRGDTGRQVHQEVILPVVRELDNVFMAYELWRGKGRPIPRDWDDDAHFNWKGKRL